MERHRAGRAEAAAAIWNWRAPASEAAPPESPNRARIHGLLQALVVAAIGALIGALWSRTIATLVFTVSGVIGVSALISPTGLYAALRRGLAALGRLTGRGMTWVLMAPTFYLIFLPFGLLFRRGRRDRLKRYFEDDAASYWEPHSGPTASSPHYDRQY